VTYVIVEVGSSAVWGAGAFLLGLALIALSVAAGAVFPAWLRAAAAIAGIGGVGGVAGVAFFPSGLLILWGVAIGLWLVFAAQRRVEPAFASAAA
jgi:hypothetical protein